jgi:hypothetical protein
MVVACSVLDMPLAVEVSVGSPSRLRPASDAAQCGDGSQRVLPATAVGRHDGMNKVAVRRHVERPAAAPGVEGELRRGMCVACAQRLLNVRAAMTGRHSC